MLKNEVSMSEKLEHLDTPKEPSSYKFLRMVQDVDELASRIKSLSNKLNGQGVAPAGSATDMPPKPVGLIPILTEALETHPKAIQHCHECLNELENQLLSLAE